MYRIEFFHWKKMSPNPGHLGRFEASDISDVLRLGMFCFWDVLRLGTFWVLGRFQGWDVLRLGRFGAVMFYSWDVLRLGAFCFWEVLRLGAFCFWEVLRLGTFVAGTFCIVTFCLRTFLLEYPEYTTLSQAILPPEPILWVTFYEYNILPFCLWSFYFLLSPQKKCRSGAFIILREFGIFVHGASEVLFTHLNCAIWKYIRNRW